MARQKVITLVDGERREAEISTGIDELAADPASPVPTDVWVLRTMENPAGTLQAIVGGFPMITETDVNHYDLSFMTAGAGIKRVRLA